MNWTTEIRRWEPNFYRKDERPVVKFSLNFKTMGAVGNEQMCTFPWVQTKKLFELVFFVPQNRMTCYSIGDSFFVWPTGTVACFLYVTVACRSFHDLGPDKNFFSLKSCHIIINTGIIVALIMVFRGNENLNVKPNPVIHIRLTSRYSI